MNKITQCISVVLFSLSMSVALAAPGNNGGGSGGCGQGQQTNGCSGGVTDPSGVYYGGNASSSATGGNSSSTANGGSVKGSGNSKVDNKVTNNNKLNNQNNLKASNKQGQSQYANSESGAYAQNQGNTSNISIGGDTYQRNAPPVIAAEIPSVPTSCRLYLFGGGTNVNGAVSGSIPLGNDQTCLSIAAVNMMERVGGFTQQEKQQVVCKVEGLEDLPTCKAINNPQKQEVQQEIVIPQQQMKTVLRGRINSDGSVTYE